MKDEPTHRYAASASGLPCSTGCSPPRPARGSGVGSEPSFVLRRGLMHPSVVARPLHSALLCAVLTSRLVTSFRRLAHKNGSDTTPSGRGRYLCASSCSSSYQSWWDRSDQPSVLAHRGLLRKGRPAWTYFVWLEMNGPLDRWHARQFGPGTTPRYRVPAAFIALKITRSFKNSSAAHEKNRCTTSPFSLDREQGSDRLPLALSLHWITTSVLSLVP